VLFAGVVPMRDGRSTKFGHIDSDRARGRHVRHDQGAIGRTRGRGIVVVVNEIDIGSGGESAETGDDDSMVRVRDEVEPRTRREESGYVSELNRAGSIEVTLPAAGERPRIAITVKLAGCSAEHGPVFLASKSGISGVGVFKFVICLNHEVGQEIGAIVILQQTSIGGVIGVSSVEFDNRIPVRII